MKKALRYTLRIVAGVIILFLIACFSAWIYISTNKASILKRVKTELSAHIKGEIFIEDLGVSFFSTFPKFSIGLYKITIRDSLWKEHQHDLLRADKVFASLSYFRLLSGHIIVDKITIEDGSVFLLTDSTGYSNLTSINSNQSTANKNPAAFPDIEIRDIKLMIEIQDRNRNKLFSFEIKRLTCNSIKRESFLQLNLNMSVLVHTMEFKRKNGGFAKGKMVTGKFRVQFDPKKKILQFENISLRLDKQPFRFSGNFSLDIVPVPFALTIQTENIEYKQATALLSSNIQKKLDQYTINDPINIIVIIDGKDPENGEPLIQVKVNAKKNDITTPYARFTAASFSAIFKNDWMPGEGRGDDNSAIRFTTFSGIWENILLNSDTITFTNLIHPVLTCDLHSVFDLTVFNDLTGDPTIQFTKGTGRFDTRFKGSVEAEDSNGIEKNLTGNISMDSASLRYLPRGIFLTHCDAKIRLADKNMYIDQLTAYAGSSELNMHGELKNLFSFMDKTANKPSLDWAISSAKLNLNDFTSYLRKKSVVSSKKTRKALFVKILSDITSILNTCDVQLQIKAKELTYKKFFATNTSASIFLTDDKVMLKNVMLDHGGGSLTLHGSVSNGDPYNSIELESAMNKVDINKVFSAFANFGQNAITDKNLKGWLNANIKMSALITDKAEVVSNSLKGTIDFNIIDGELIQFEPVEKIAVTAFKNRDFSDMHFAELKDKFDVNGTEIKVNRMEIRSNALHMFVEGLYDVKKGADMSIQIPISNLKEVKEDAILSNKGIHSNTGASVNLRAKTGDDGKLKITWDPFRKALKKSKTKELKSSGQ